jgi:RimJ/RimL family protein N-acetyltransferase
MKPPVLKTGRLELRSLDPDALSPAYCEWLNDPAVNQYLEARFHVQTKESVRVFVRTINDSLDSAMFGIFLRDDGRHIGNIKIGPIDPNHARADIGLLLGDRTQWGKGFATEAIGAVTEYAFDTLHLNKVTAGCYAANEGSLRAFQKLGFREIGRRHNHARTAQGWMDDVLLERCNSNPPPP